MFVALIMAFVTASDHFHPDFTRLEAPEELHLRLHFVEHSTGNPLEGELWLMSDYYGWYTEHLVSPIEKGEASLDFIRLEKERFFVLGTQNEACHDVHAPYGSYGSYVLVIKVNGEVHRSVTLDQPFARGGKAGSDLLAWPDFSSGICDMLASFGHAADRDGVYTVAVEGYTPRRFSFSECTGKPLPDHCFTANILLFQSNHCGMEEILPLEFPIETGPDGVATVHAPAGPLSIWVGYTVAPHGRTFAAMPVLTSEPYLTGWEVDINIQGALDCPRLPYKFTLKDQDAKPIVGVTLNGTVIEDAGCGNSCGWLGVTDSHGEVAFDLCPNLLRPLGFSLAGTDHPEAQDYFITEEQCLELYEYGALTIIWDTIPSAPMP